MDKKTNKVLSQGERLTRLVESEGWQDAKRILINKVLDLDMISKMEDFISKSPEELKNEILLRYTIRDIILQWIAEIEGGADQTKQYYEVAQQELDDIFIRRASTQGD